MSDLLIDKIFPNALSEGYKLTSPEDINYNCIAWAAEITNRPIWPQSYGWFWPQDVKSEVTLDAFIDLYTKYGYQLFTPQNDKFEKGYVKVAIYVDRYGIPTHAARQLPNGNWTSKLGAYKDIEHNNLKALEGIGIHPSYGTVAVIMKKTIKFEYPIAHGR